MRSVTVIPARDDRLFVDALPVPPAWSCQVPPLPLESMVPCSVRCWRGPRAAFSRSRAACAAAMGAASTSPPRLGAAARKGCCSSASAGRRSAGSFIAQAATKSAKSADQSSGRLSLGGGSRLILKMTRMGCTSACGGTVSAISMAVTPSAHTSTDWSYCASATTSGAIQCGVPMKVVRLSTVLVSSAATPKSASLTSPSSVSRMLPALMSRCSLPIECRYLSPSTVSRST
mmetsp:Transcript_19221/g.59768  ORF Transcript_19221/g.59768 Transcript_19221/m.59768 type:complete len:231 (-) Transcript_19221:492-1184(-)